MFSLHFLLTVSFIFGLLAPVYAEQAPPPEKITARLENVRTKINQEQEKLRSLAKERDKLETSNNYLEQELREVTQAREVSSSFLAKVQEQINQIAEAEEAAKTATARFRDRARERLVGLYKMRKRVTFFDYLMRSRSATDFLRRASAMRQIARHDQNTVWRLRTLIEDVRAKQQQLIAKQNEQQRFVSEVSRLEQQLETKRKHQATLLSRLDQEKQKHQTVVAKLNDEATRLEQLVSEMMGKRDEVVPRKEVETINEQGNVELVKGFEGRGLAGLKGKLIVPVIGTVVRQFGKQQHDEFVDVLFVKGLEFAAKAGTKVKSVADGKVIFNHVLPGYGNVVIVDHGKRYYTLYGRLAASMRRVGEVVNLGDAVGVLGDGDAKGRNFYFELRTAGKPENPIDYFKKKPTVSGN